MEYRYTGIIISKNDIAETDRIYNIFTSEAGKIRAVGKGTRNPNARLSGSLEPLTMSEIAINRTRGLGKVTGAIVIENFSALKSDFEMITRVFFAVGIFDRLIAAEEKDQRIFGLLLDYLKTAEKLCEKNMPDAKKDVVTLGFLFKLLDFSGYGTNMESCVNCGEKLTPKENFFSAMSGGIFCQKCAGRSGRKVKIGSGSIKLIRLFVKNSIKNLAKLSVPQEDVKNTKIILGEMVRWTVG